MHISRKEGRTKGLKECSETRQPEINKDIRSKKGDVEIATGPDVDNGVAPSREPPHRPWLVPGVGRL